MTENELRTLWSRGDYGEMLYIGFRNVQQLVKGYDPAGPHLLRTPARADASTFNDPDYSVYEVMRLADHAKCSVMSTDAAIIFEFHCMDREDKDWQVIGTERYSKPVGSGPWTIVETDHGLMAEGDCEITESPTEWMSAIFTREEGDNYVLASLHPGKPQEPGDYSGLQVGDQLTLEQLNDRGVKRIKPRK